MNSSTEITISTLIHGPHMDAKPIFMNIHKLAHHEAQGELMHGTLDQQKIKINVTACISLTSRSIESTKASHFLQSYAPFLKSNLWNLEYTTQVAESTKERHENHPKIFWNYNN